MSPLKVPLCQRVRLESRFLHQLKEVNFVSLLLMDRKPKPERQPLSMGDSFISCKFRDEVSRVMIEPENIKLRDALSHEKTAILIIKMHSLDLLIMSLKHIEWSV